MSGACLPMLATMGTAGTMHGWAIATAAVVAAGCALVGTLLVVRRLSLLGDAVSHAVLPGLAIAVLAGGRPGGVLVFVGAVTAALVTVWGARALGTAGGLDEDSNAGVVFTTMFALGVVLVTAFARGMHLDPQCLLYGDLEYVPFDTVALAGVDVPRAFVVGAVVLAVLVAAALATWKLQVFTAFDAAAARAAGVPVAAVTAGLLAATAAATVASFETVGAVLVVALLVVPAAAAELLVRRLHHVAVVAVLLAVVGAAVGYLAAWTWNVNAAGAIAVVLGVEYVLAACLAPQDGFVARLRARVGLAWRIACEDALAGLWRAEESGAVPSAGLGGLATARLRIGGLIERRGTQWRLTPRGRREAEMIVRSHRLWEAWLGRHADLPVDHLHPPAEWVEHHLGSGLRHRIEEELGRGVGDPHGRDIPPES
ncbi:manganese ABC transporter permease [Planctomycetia bacterium]|nr:manganese ABC transporter permease [Planctomycetia bacterium]